MNHMLICLLTLLFSLSGPAMGSYSDFQQSSLAARAAPTDLTYLYQKVGPAGEHLKFGITKNPATRYTSDQLGGGQLKVVAEGPKKEMLQLERNLHETLPIGPEEGQLFYIQKQVNKGLKPPPYE
jgi:hypothetical protein